MPLRFGFNGGKALLVQSVQVAQLATLDRDELRVLLSEKLFPSWISFIDYDKVRAPANVEGLV
jgi:hypothetical protein